MEKKQSYIKLQSPKLFSAILVFLLLVPTLILVRKWEAIGFWMFVKFGIQFKDKDEMNENLQNVDYDGFVNYT